MSQVRRAGRIARFGYGVRWIPALPSGPTVTVYCVYSNTGAGDPIDYESPIATVANPGFLTSALTYPSIWSFGVRALDLGSGLEEQNVDAVVTILLNANGNDITNQPSPPTGLRAFALSGGSIRVEWGYPATVANRIPTGFHLYITSPLPLGGPLRPTVVIQRTRGKARKLPGEGGNVRWNPGDGGCGPYSVPAATVTYNLGYLNCFTCDLSGFMNGTTYTIGVRSYNAAAEETNTNAISVTAISVGPTAVAGLVAIATP